MLKISGSTEGGVGVGSDGVGVGNDNGGSRKSDFDRKFYPLYDSRTTYLNAQDKLINRLNN